jgi:hypothetical protein
MIATITTLLVAHPAWPQDLSPRAYVITPLHGNGITLTYAYFTGSLDFNGAVPITGATGNYSVPSFAYYHSFSFFGHSANAVGILPYGIGNFQGEVLGSQRSVYRSGLGDSVFRLSVNLKGAPAMELPQFVKWKQKTLLGVSLKVIAPTGQYNPELLVNWGSNRWSFKPEFGYSRRFDRKWVLDAYAGAWFFTTNPQFVSKPPPPKPQSLNPVGSFEGHLSYDFKPFLWASLDGNFWFGGTATNGGITIPASKQTASRLGVTGSFPLARRNPKRQQSIKVSFSRGAYVRFGGDYTNISVAWQYSWIGNPK